MKSKLRQKQDEESAAGLGTFDINENRGRTNYIFSVGIIELTIFNVEDATTLRIFAVMGGGGGSFQSIQYMVPMDVTFATFLGVVGPLSQHSSL